MAWDLSIDIEQHPPLSDTWRAFCKGGIIHPRKEYHARNRDIVAVCGLLVACPHEYQDPGHGGTWYTIRHARKQRTNYTVVYPDGSKDAFRFGEEHGA